MSLLGPDGAPINPAGRPLLVPPGAVPPGPQEITMGDPYPLNGLRWGVMFLVLDGDVLGVHPLRPEDVQAVNVDCHDGLGVVDWITSRSLPMMDGEHAGQHRIVKGWGQMPGIAAGLLAGHMTADLDAAEAAGADQPADPDATEGDGG